MVQVTNLNQQKAHNNKTCHPELDSGSAFIIVQHSNTRTDAEL